MSQGASRLWRPFVVNGLLGLVFAAASFSFDYRDCGGSWRAICAEPSFIGCAALAVASIVAGAGRNRIAVGVAAYLAIALAVSNLIAGMAQVLSPVAHFGAWRLLLSLVMLLWAVYVIILRRFLRPRAASQAPPPA